MRDQSADFNTFRDLAVPNATTSPCVGFFCAEVGSRMPPTEIGSLASTFTKTRSPTGDTVLYCAAQG